MTTAHPDSSWTPNGATEPHAKERIGGGRSGSDPDAVISDLFDYAARLVGITAGIVFILDEQGRFVSRSSLEVDNRAIASLPRLDMTDRSILTRCVAEDATHIWPSNHSQTDPDDWLGDLGWRQALAIPLRGDHNNGVFLVGWANQTRLDPGGVEVLQAAAAHTASTLEAAHLLQELRREEQRLRSIVDAIPLPVLIVDTTTKAITWTNNEAESLLGEVRGRPYLEVASDIQATTLKNTPIDDITSAGSHPQSVSPGIRIRLTDPDGNIRVVVPTTASLNQTESLVILSDVTAEALTDQTRFRFLRMVSHHLRTPLTPLLGYTRLLADHLSPARDTVIDEALTVLTETLEGMVQEVGRLEQVASIDPPGTADLRTVAPRELIVDAWQRVSGDSHNLVIQGDVEGALDSYPERISVALVELFNNALTHGAPPVTVTVSRSNDRTKLSIHDEGAGFPPHWAEEIFTPYVSATDGYQAAIADHHGLGLTLARLNIEAAGGTLTYDAGNRAFVIGLGPTRL